MTKRIKLLSVMVAALLCFTAGLAILFGSNNTAKADVEVPTVSYSDQKTDIDWSTGKNFNHVGISTGKGIATDWFVLEYYVPAGNTLAADTSITFALVEGNSWASYETVGSKPEADGLMAKTSFAVAADSSYMANATAADVKVRLAMNLTDGKIYGSIADAEFEEIAAIENFAYVSSAETKIPYIVFGGNPSIKRLNNVKLYTEEGVITDYAAKNPGNLHHGAGSFIADRTTSLNLSAERPAGSNTAYILRGTSLNLVNTNPTTSDWIIYEYTIAAGTTYTNAQNGICTALSNDGWIGAEDSTSNSTRSSYLHAFASAIPPQTIGNNLFAAAEDTTVKMAVNTVTGLFAYYRNGAWTTFGGAYNAAGISGTDRYFSIKANGAAFDGKIKDVVCYDANGVDLGITSTMEKIVDLGLDNIDTSNVVALDYAGSGTKNLYNATATTAKWIIFEWNNKAGNSVVAGGGHMFSYGLGATQQNTELVSVTDRTQLLTTTGNVKVAFETKTGLIYRSFNGGDWTACPEGTVNKAGASGPLYAGILWNNGNVTYAAIDGLMCYDENGNDLGVKTDFCKPGTIANDVYTLGAHGGFGRFQGNVNYVDFEGNATTATAIGKIAAKKYGTEATTLEFVSGGGALQLFYPSATNADAPNWDPDDSSTYTWSMFDNQWYLVEAGTLFGSVVLTEDVIIRIHSTELQIFKADYEFAINYTGVEASEHSNPATRTFLEAVELAPATAEGKIFSDWYVGGAHNVNDIAAYTYGDITVRGLWKSDSYIKNYALSIGADLSVTVKAELIGYSQTRAVFTTADGTIIQEVAQVHTAWGPVINASWEFAYTFTGVLPQHLGDDINVKIYNLDVLVLETDINVAEYLDAKVAEAGADAALAQDVLYYGAAAQLYTGHDVENVVADLSAAAPVEIPADASVYAKAGEKDANYYWYEAKVVYDNTVKLVLTIVAPADSAITVAFGTDEIAATVNEAGLYEVAFAVPAHAFGTSADLTIKVDGEAVGQVLTYSVNSYIVNAPATDADYATLLERLYCLGVSAAAYANA